MPIIVLGDTLAISLAVWSCSLDTGECVLGICDCKEPEEKDGRGGKTDNLKTCQGYIVKFKRHFKEPNHSLFFFFYSLFFFSSSLLSLSFFFFFFFFSFLSFRTVAGRLNRPMGLQVRDIGM